MAFVKEGDDDGNKGDGDGNVNGDGDGDADGNGGDRQQQRRQWQQQRGWRASNGSDNCNGEGDGTKDMTAHTTPGERGVMVAMGHGLCVSFAYVERPQKIRLDQKRTMLLGA